MVKWHNIKKNPTGHLSRSGKNVTIYGTGGLIYGVKNRTTLLVIKDDHFIFLYFYYTLYVSYYYVV